MEQLKNCFHTKVLEPKDNPKGMIAHEVLGIGVLLSAWTGCYIIHPDFKLARIAKKSLKTISNSCLKSISKSSEERAKA